MVAKKTFKRRHSNDIFKFMTSTSTDEETVVGAFRLKKKALNLTSTSAKMILQREGVLWNFKLMGTEAHSQNTITLTLEDPTTSNNKPVALEAANHAIHGTKPFLTTGDLGNKRAFDVGINITRDQFKKYRAKLINGVEVNYDEMKKKK